MFEGTEAPEGSPADDTPEYDGGRDISKLTDAQVEPDATPVVAAPPVTAPDAQAAVARAWKVYQGDKELADFDPTKMTAAEFLALTIGYTANGKEQKRNFDGVLRNAQQGHHNAEVRQRIEQERDHAVKEWQTHRTEVESHRAQRKVWTAALTAATRGNVEPLRQIVEQFQKAMDADEAPAPTVPSGYVSQEAVAREAAGRQVYETRILPEAAALGKRFGFPQEQVATAIIKMVENYPTEFLTNDVLESIMKVELPSMLERLREEHPIPTPEVSAEAKRITELEAKLNELTGKKVEQDNAAVKAVHTRRAAAPPGVPTTAAAAGEFETSPADTESAAGMRRWLRDLK